MRDSNMHDRIAITGIGLISSLGDSSNALFDGLCKGESGIRHIDAFPFDGCHCHLAARLIDFRPEKYLSGRSLRPLDRISHLASAACGLALESSRWDAASRTAAELSLVVGTMFGGMHTIGEFDRAAIVSGPASVSPMAFANTVINAAAGQSAIWHKLRGVNSTVAAGSISGISAICHAFDLICNRGSYTVLAGGVDEFSIESYLGFGRAGLLCTENGCSECPIPFDQHSNGLALGEGAVFIVLEELNYAKERGTQVLAEMGGYGAAFDRSRGKNPDLAVNAIMRAMCGALEKSRIAPAEVDFVSASGNGSPASDRYELMALRSFFGERAKHLPITAIKCGIGEALGAAGPAQLVVAIESLNRSLLPGVIGLRSLPLGYRWEGISSRTRPIEARCALVNAVGLDGTCCSLVIAKPYQKFAQSH